MTGSTDAVAGDPAAGSSPALSDPAFEGLGAGSVGEAWPRAEGRPPDPKAAPPPPLAAARYKSMSPAKLPITRTPCLTIPSGFSPSALLESPVLLTNIKAEPSPTTGTLHLSSFMGKTVRSSTLSSPRDASCINLYDNGGSADFEFKPHVNTTDNSELPPKEPQASISLDKENAYSTSVPYNFQSQDKILPNQEVKLSVSAPNRSIEPFNLEKSQLVEVGSDDLQQKVLDQSPQDTQSDLNETIPSLLEKSAEDGYNWRKYGQKHVKGSEYPRSYYKCTHPNCQMKKQLERSRDGQITEIIYKGRHDHPKPQASRRLAVGGLLSGQVEEKTDGFSSLMSAGKSSNEPACGSHQLDANDTTELSPASVSEDDGEVRVKRTIVPDEITEDDPESKRRKTNFANIDATSIGKINREPRVVVQTVSEVDILDDGYRWRKYGQKVVKGNPNPRSYYKCTNAGCPVRKHVERASHDPKAVITTYEGKHNHDVPTSRTASHEAATPLLSDGPNARTNPMSATFSGIMMACSTVAIPQPYAQPADGGDTISLDLGVGISANQVIERQHPLQNGQVLHHQIQSASSDYSKPTYMSSMYGGSSAMVYDPKDKGNEFAFKTTTPANHHSDVYYSSAGNLVMGP